MTTQLQLGQRCEKGRVLTKSGCDCLPTSRTYFHGKAQWTAARASDLLRPLALALLSFVVGISFGCGGSAKITSVNSKTPKFCPPGHNVKTDLRIGQRHRWCETRRGIAHGPVKVFYPDGSAMLSFELIDGRIHGLYQAWHPSGRLAIKAAYQHGRQLGEATFRPPFGPPSMCKPGTCRGMQSALDRPFCLETDIQSTFEKGHDKLRSCLKDSAAAHVFVASWTIDLLGEVKVAKVEAQDEAPDVLECMTNALNGFRFPAPLGQTCAVSMEFELKNR